MRSGPDQRSRGRYQGNRPNHQHQAPQRSHTFDSNGPNLKIRGNAHQIFQRYVALAREAGIAGDPIAAENFYQHAEHYFRTANAGRDVNQQGMPSPRPNTPSNSAMNSEAGASVFPTDQSQPRSENDDPVSPETPIS